MSRARRHGDAAAWRTIFPISAVAALAIFPVTGCQSISNPRIGAPPAPLNQAVGRTTSTARVLDFYLPDADYFAAFSGTGSSGRINQYAERDVRLTRTTPPYWPLPVANDLAPLLAEARTTHSLGTIVVTPYAFKISPRPEAVADSESRPLRANLRRIDEALDALGFLELFQYRAVYAPTSSRADHERVVTQTILDDAVLRKTADKQVAVILQLDQAGRLTVKPGPAVPTFRQHALTRLLIRLDNPHRLKGSLTVSSPQSGPVYGGGAENSLTRQCQPQLRSVPENEAHPERTWDVELHRDRDGPALASGLSVEYGLLFAKAHAAGSDHLRLQFQLAPESSAVPGTPGAPTEFILPCEVVPATKVQLFVRDEHDRPTIGKFTFVDARGQVHPSMPKRQAPDFFFQRHIYRADGETISLPPGTYDVQYSRGPEYELKHRVVIVPDAAESKETFQLARWVEPQAYGFYSGDHHIHGAGCSHHTSPTEGVSPADMFRQVKGEGLNVGAVLIWGPSYDFQRRYFSADADAVSEPLTLLKYDVEVSGFGSQRLGHVCLLNLRDQSYPGSHGTVEGRPTWTVPTLRWAKQQGGVTGFAHSVDGMYVVPNRQAQRLMQQFDSDGDEYLTAAETKSALLPEPFATVDRNHDGRINLFELEESHSRAMETLPNFAIPELNGPGAMEICVAAALGECDFIGSMDTARIQEWSIWYHLLNCGLPIATAGETDFPCMSGTRVGQGRTYVRLGHGEGKLNYAAWCRGLAAGCSYVSDGYAHALDFTVSGKRYDETLELPEPATVTVTAEVAFGVDTPPGIKHGLMPDRPLHRIGDTVTLDPDTETTHQYRDRRVELIVNGQVVEAKTITADDKAHTLSFTVPIERSSWVAIRQFPQLHTNPIRVLVAGKPIRASRRSAEWCVAVIEQLWKNRAAAISEGERPAAEQAYEVAKKFYRRIAAESRAAQLQ